jgi:RHS repeat-associated protein
MVGHGAVAIVHDGDGNRVSETVGSTTTKYLIDTLNPTGYSQVLDELVGGAVTKTYTYGLQRISENQLSGSTWTPTFYGYDGHGNVRFTTNTAGTVGNTYQYDAFGMPIASTGAIANTYLYSGERFDSNINLYHLRARFYNALTGRFETMDPVRAMKLEVLLFTPLTVTTIFPVVAPAGTITFISVELHSKIVVARVPLNLIVLVPGVVPKPVPEMVTVPPTAAACGA